MALVTLPSASTMLTDIGGTSASVFDNFYPLGMTAAGWFTGALAAIFFVTLIVYAIKHISHKMPEVIRPSAGASNPLSRFDQGALHHYYRRRYLEDTDDRSERGDFLIGGQ